jgi:hypothetical protein
MSRKRNQRPSLNLEFPDWSGHTPVPYWRETMEQMHLRSEAMLPLIKSRPNYHEDRLADKIDVPFEL